MCSDFAQCGSETVMKRSPRFDINGTCGIIGGRVCQVTVCTDSEVGEGELISRQLSGGRAAAWSGGEVSGYQWSCQTSQPLSSLGPHR